ncbi:MAG: hypothetical protein ACLP0H_21365 [Terriglobales bacterium]
MGLPNQGSRCGQRGDWAKAGKVRTCGRSNVSGIVVNCGPGALAHLGRACANVLQSRTSQGADADAARVRALAAYKDFLTLWKDADQDSRS